MPFFYLQEQFVRDFSAKLDELGHVFHNEPGKAVSLIEALENQTHFLHGEDYHTMRWIPRPVHITLTTLQELAKCKPHLVAAALVS